MGFSDEKVFHFKDKRGHYTGDTNRDVMRIGVFPHYVSVKAFGAGQGGKPIEAHISKQDGLFEVFDPGDNIIYSEIAGGGWLPATWDDDDFSLN